MRHKTQVWKGKSFHQHNIAHNQHNQRSFSGNDDKKWVGDQTCEVLHD